MDKIEQSSKTYKPASGSYQWAVIPAPTSVFPAKPVPAQAGSRNPVKHAKLKGFSAFILNSQFSIFH